MKLIHLGVAAVGLVALAGCNSRTPAENAAANVRATAENRADAIENMASNVSSAADNRVDALQNKADAVRDSAENRADSLERNDRGPAAANTTGM
jgi:hypothetical protein